MSTKKLVVCGDSFNSISTQTDPVTGQIFKGTHWSEIVADQLDYQLINFAFGGASTSMIVLQILEAIKLNPDLIITGWACGLGTRIEYLINEKDIVIGENLGEFAYKNRPHPYHQLNRIVNEKVTSSNILLMPDQDLAKKLAILFPNRLLVYKDIWAVSYAVSELSRSKIPFLVFETPPKFPKTEPKPFTNELLKHCLKENIIFQDELDFSEYEIKSNSPPIYHTAVESQIEIANYIMKRIKDLIS